MPRSAVAEPPVAPPAASPARTAVAEQTETLRQLVIESRDGDVAPGRVESCLEAINRLHRDDPAAFTVEDKRWVNKLRGTLSLRQAARHPDGVKHTPKAKRKGDQLIHCWRCETPVDERFVVNCVCDSKAFHWMTCPVCGACGCQRTAETLV